MIENGELLYDKQERIMIQPINPDSRLNQRNSCNPNPQLMPPNQFNCHGKCVNKKCIAMSNSGYYYILCPLNGNIGPSCAAHVAYTNGKCKFCCNDPKSSCLPPSNNGFWQRCDCLVV